MALVENPQHLLIEPDDVPIIYKIHGGVAPDGSWITSIITEDDYFDIGGRLYSGSFLPPQLASILHRSSMLFLGYSLRDVHARFLVRSVTDRQRNHFLVSRQIARIDHIRFKQLGVTAIESPIDRFLDQLTSMKTS